MAGWATHRLKRARADLCWTLHDYLVNFVKFIT